MKMQKRNRKDRCTKGSFLNNSIVVGILTILLVFTLSVYIAKVVIPASDRVDCLKLQKQSVEYKDNGFYITKSERDICDAVGLPVNAPIITN